MRRFLSNFWVCLGIALLCVWLAWGEFNVGNTGWAWFYAVIGLLNLNDARRAINRGKEESSDD